ncbi:MAG: DUF3179 domain-containing protein [Rhodospirillales bacterium]|jgi:hypothetical protein|nr:DUF3179 domain-containing protein [Rhodospirillales bacterium]
MISFVRVFIVLAAVVMAGSAQADPSVWKRIWPNTDFEKHSVDYDTILWGGVPKDGIRSIENPKFFPASQVTDLTPTDPVIGVIINGEAKAYPLSVLTRHEIANDMVGGVPVAVTYCPLCNSAVVFDRRVSGRVLEFGVSGNLRNSDMVMYDRQTESWWQQFLGEGIVGEMTGTTLKTIPSRLESFANFKTRAANGRVMDARGYGTNPYAYYDTRNVPYGFFRGPWPNGIEPMVHVVVVEGEAWSLPLLASAGKLTHKDLVFTWTEGQNSALDSSRISEGRDVGNVIVKRKSDGKDVTYDVTFAFVYHAFHPDGVIHKE